VASPSESHRPGTVVQEGKRVVPLELLYDLVFVFAVTQVSHLLLNDLSWTGAVHAVLALGVVWWAWNYTVWVTSEVDLEPIRVRLLFLANAREPRHGGRRPRGLSRDQGRPLAVPDGRRRPRFEARLGTGGEAPDLVRRLRVLWVAGGIVEGPGRVVLWTAALAIDLAGPLVLYWIPGRPRLPFALWKVDFQHLAERYETFVIIALGETIVFTGATVSERGFDDGRFLAFLLAFLSTACLYWLYFDGFPAVARARLGTDGVHIARDAYMYIHVVLAAGIILSAVGDGLVIDRPTEILSGAQIAVVTVGPALYLLGHVLFRFRITGSVSWTRLGGAVACGVIGLVGSVVPGLVLSGLLVGILVVVIVGEARMGPQEGQLRPA
jgi:low temperature requirement protein LtrA